jgi:hypothetical protein
MIPPSIKDDGAEARYYKMQQSDTSGQDGAVSKWVAPQQQHDTIGKDGEM